MSFRSQIRTANRCLGMAEQLLNSAAYRLSEALKTVDAPKDKKDELARLLHSCEAFEREVREAAGLLNKYGGRIDE